MKKLITILLILISTICYSQDTSYFFRVNNWGKSNVEYTMRKIYKDKNGNEKIKIEKFNSLDELIEQIKKHPKDRTKPQGQGIKQQDTTFTTEEKELISLLNQTNEIDSKIAELQKTRTQIEGVIIYISQKFKIDINKLIKRIKK